MKWLLNAWLLQHYALVVWMTTGVNRRRRKPEPHDKLIPLINYAVSGQVLFAYQSLIFLVAGRSLPTNVVILGIVLVGTVLIAWALPRLELYAKRAGVPALFRKLTDAQRRRQAWAGFLLFWAAFFSMFVVGFSMH